MLQQADTTYGKFTGSINLEIMLYKSADLLLTAWISHPSIIYAITAVLKTKEFPCKTVQQCMCHDDVF